MTIVPKHIQRSMSLKLGLAIVLFVVLVFVLSLGFLFVSTYRIVKQEAMERATVVLNNTALRVTGYMNAIETATTNIEWLVQSNLRPDSILCYSRRVVELNPDVNGCSITMEPYYFPELGRYFSAYSVRQADSIVTVREGDYDYYSKVWYKTPFNLGRACWVDPFDDYNAGTLSASEIIASYCKPLYNRDSTFFGVIATDLSLKWLSQTISQEKPYPHSYSIMIGKEGHFFVHPDTAKLFTQTIFSGLDPKENADVFTLGVAMMKGQSGCMQLNVNGQPCYVFYQPLQHAGWSIALVCPESDIFVGHKRLGYVILALITIGLLLILVFCLRTVGHFVEPLNKLAEQSRYIASVHFDECMPRSERTDVVGALQNSFATMQESIHEHVGELQRANEEAEQRNRQLLNASRLAQEAEQKKAAFIQDISHQIRTPLNIIQGFLHVLYEAADTLSESEKESIVSAMHHNSSAITRISTMLVSAARLESDAAISADDLVGCNDLARDVIASFYQDGTGGLDLRIETSLPDTLHMRTNREVLYHALRELLFNAKKFAGDSPVRLLLTATATTVCYTVEDHGPGIPESEREHIFKHFFKLNDFTEGLGLGLAISRRIVRKLGGDLILDNNYTQGCRFVLSLPLAEED